MSLPKDWGREVGCNSLVSALCYLLVEGTDGRLLDAGAEGSLSNGPVHLASAWAALLVKIVI